MDINNNNEHHQHKKLHIIEKIIWAAMIVIGIGITNWVTIQNHHQESIGIMEHDIADVLNLSTLIANRCLCEHEVIECDMDVINNNLKKIFEHVNKTSIK